MPAPVAPDAAATVSMRRPSDPVRELTEILREIGARPTYDHERNLTDPCCRCGTVDRYRDLVEIGRYTRPMGGGLRPGDAIVRPMCERCREETEPQTPSVGDIVEWIADGDGRARLGTVTSIEPGGRINLESEEIGRGGKRKLVPFWFDAHEVSRLRVVESTKGSRP